MRKRYRWSLGVVMVLIACAAAALVISTGEARVRQTSGQTVVIETGRNSSQVERNAARLLLARLQEIAGVSASIQQEKIIGQPETPNVKSIHILLGIPEHHEGIATSFKKLRIPPLTQIEPGPEGFLLQSIPSDRGIGVLAAGVDDRGTVYAVGELLRRATFAPGSVSFPPDLSIRTAPAFEVRGTQIGQSNVLLEKGHARKWTEKEFEHAVTDTILAGANVIQVGGPERSDPTRKVLAAFGMKTLFHYTPNVGSGPPEWQASESIGRSGYLCPSIPAARAALLAQCEEFFKKCPDYDYVRLVGGDGGGCECDKCKPFGGVFIRLCEDQAAIIHKYHPKTEIFVTNQKFENASDEAIFQYLQEKPRTWMRAFCYGPGSDAMSWQPGHRQTHRMDLFRFPGFGPTSRYLHEILHQLPPQQDIVFYNELTHWRYSEFGYVQAYPRPDKDGNHPPHWGHEIYERMPDRYLNLVYDRLSFFAWPRFYYKMFGETVRYGIGDCTHSSGTQDHFNQWMWQRLLWDPQRSLDSILAEYCTTWFGPEAAPEMHQALLSLEQYLQDDPSNPLPSRASLRKYYDLVKTAGGKMPAFRRKAAWLWLEHRQKAAIDLHTALTVKAQMELRDAVQHRITVALSAANPLPAITESEKLLNSQTESDQQKQLRAEAIRYGEESNQIYGLRSEGIYSLDHDFIGLGWIKRQLARAAVAKEEERREMLSLIADYENPGPGGFYDNCGTYEKMPHLVNGYPYDFGQPLVSGMMSEMCTRSQKTMCSTQDEKDGVAFKYEGLDPTAHYKIRVTLVGPKYQGRYGERMNQKAENIYANGALIAPAVSVPVAEPEMYTFEIPAQETKTGSVTIRFQKMPDVANGDRVSVEQWRNTGGWGTIVSEIWLMKRP